MLEPARITPTNQSGLVPSAPTIPGVVACAAYSNGRRTREVTLDEIDQVLLQPDTFVWVGLFEPETELLQSVQRQFGLHDLAIEDAHRAHQRPKLEQYEDSLFAVVRTARLVPLGEDEEDSRLEFGETHVFVGRRYLITVRHGSDRSYAELRQRCEASPQLLTQGPGYVLYALMDFLVDQYFPIVSAFEEDVAQLEERLFGGEGASINREAVSRIYRSKRDLLAIKRAVAPLIDVCNRLMRFDLELIPTEVRPYFRDVYDHAIRINEMIDNLRELLTTAFEVNLSLISVALNEDMQRLAAASVTESRDTRRLAAWGAIIAVPTMIAGIYGMNFQDMPELGWAYGYPTVVSTMVVICMILYIGFKRSSWL